MPDRDEIFDSEHEREFDEEEWYDTLEYSIEREEELTSLAMELNIPEVLLK
jgi:hypothetical protein